MWEMDSSLIRKAVCAKCHGALSGTERLCFYAIVLVQAGVLFTLIRRWPADPAPFIAVAFIQLSLGIPMEFSYLASGVKLSGGVEVSKGEKTALLLLSLLVYGVPALLGLIVAAVSEFPVCAFLVLSYSALCAISFISSRERLRALGAERGALQF
jgi:hypothetical protein